MTDSLRRCPICGDFHLSSIAECDDCLHVIVRLRARVENGGGTVNVIYGTVRVRTRAQMMCPIETLQYLSEVRRVANDLRGGR